MTRAEVAELVERLRKLDALLSARGKPLDAKAIKARPIFEAIGQAVPGSLDVVDVLLAAVAGEDGAMARLEKVLCQPKPHQTSQ